MFYKFIEEYSDIIVSYHVSEYKRYGFAVSLIATINFKKGYSLFIKKIICSWMAKGNILTIGKMLMAS